MWNTCLMSGSVGLLGVGQGTYFVSVHGSKLGLREGSVGRNLVVLTGVYTYVAALVQEDMI